MPASKPEAHSGAIFFDRDGTLNHDSGYLSSPEQVVLLPGVKELLPNFANHTGFSSSPTRAA